MPIDETDLTQLPGWESLPADAQKMFARARVPSSYLKRREDSANYVVGPDLAEVDVPPSGRLVRFGRQLGGSGGDFCVDPATGEVVLVMESIPPIFVNSSLDLMARTVEVAVGFERPFTTGDAEECWIATEDFLDALQLIDRRAADPANYWGAFAADVQAGNYSDHPNFDAPYE
jgi:SUKH-4 immunity protein